MSWQDSSEVGWLCTNCGTQVNKSFGWLRANTSYTCHACGLTVEVPKNRREKYIAALETQSDTSRSQAQDQDPKSMDTTMR